MWPINSLLFHTLYPLVIRLQDIFHISFALVYSLILNPNKHHFHQPCQIQSYLVCVYEKKSRRKSNKKCQHQENETAKRRKQRSQNQIFFFFRNKNSFILILVFFFFFFLLKKKNETLLFILNKKTIKANISIFSLPFCLSVLFLAFVKSI